MSQLLDRCVDARRAILDARNELVLLCMDIAKQVQSNKVPLTEQLDIAFFMQECKRFTDEAKTEANKAGSLVERVLCAAWLILASADPETPGHLEGQFARGTPTAGVGANVPDRKSPAYRALMNAAGVPQEVIDADVVRPHWPHLCDWIERLAEQGAPLPPGIKDTYTRYHLVSLRLKKGVKLEDIDEVSHG